MKFFIPILLLILGCAHKTQSSKPELPARHYMNDQVSVKTALMQAHAGYLRGCLEAQKEQDDSDKGFKHCKERADLYIESDVLSILDQ